MQHFVQQDQIMVQQEFSRRFQERKRRKEEEQRDKSLQEEKTYDFASVLGGQLSNSSGDGRRRKVRKGA